MEMLIIDELNIEKKNRRILNNENESIVINKDCLTKNIEKNNNNNETKIIDKRSLTKNIEKNNNENESIVIDIDNVNLTKNIGKNDEESTSKKSDIYSIDSNEEILYREFLIKLEDLKQININTSVFYEKKNSCIIIPTIMLTAIGSIISFLSASTYFEENTRIAFGLTVGIITILSSLLQSFQTAFKFKTKSEMFRNSADQYDLLLIKIKFELARHDEKDFIVDFENNLLEIVSNCKYFPPQHIIDEYNKNKNLKIK